MKKRLAVGTVIVGIIAIAVLNNSETIRRYYFPIQFNNYYCRHGLSMAWSPGNLVQKSREDFCAKRYFHSGTWLGNDPYGIPVIRPESYDQVVAHLASIGYCGDVILSNEPDVQDRISPQQLAQYYRETIERIPCVRIITPNAIYVEYLAEFNEVIGADWRATDVIGIHIYQYVDDNTPDVYPIAWLENVREVLNPYQQTSPIIVSEVGPSNTWSSTNLQRYYNELYGLVESGVIREFFVYSPHSGCITPDDYPWCPHAIKRSLYANPNGNGFTRSGNALLKAGGRSGNPYP